MKKIININFHGRVIPIEETAYDLLKQYIESLRKYFANEEGRDEIIDDIENRFAELFSERLKKEATCITDDDVNVIIRSMGKPEDFEEAEINNSGSYSSKSEEKTSSQQQSQQAYTTQEPRRLYRAENDKILGGVCGGLANYLRIDPAVVRILFTLITIGGFGVGVLLYIILWIVVPSKSLQTSIPKRLYRNPENKMIGGVASGLAAYFHIDIWVPRLIFALPLILGIITSIFHNAWFEFDPGPVVFTGGFGGTLFISYIILWIVLPEASTASEKLEMRGEKVDLESIKNTIKSDLEGFKGRAKDMGNEMKERATQFSKEVGQVTQNFTSEAIPVVRKTGSGLGHAIGVLFKSFFLFIAGILSFALIMVLVWLLFSGFGAFPFKNYLLAGFWQNFLAWSSLILFLGIPVVALLTWLIRRLIGVRSKSNYLGYVFGSLWVLGLISFIFLAAGVGGNFRTRASVEDDVTISHPSIGKLMVRMEQGKVNYYGSDWFGFNWDEGGPFFSLTEDSLMMNTVRVGILKSSDSLFHIRRVKFSRGKNPNDAKGLASQIQFDIRQTDSLLYLAQGFAITPTQKFRNQQVLVLIAVPVGKKITMDKDLDEYDWFNINFNRRHGGWNVENDDWNSTYSWESNVEYIMTESGLERTAKKKRLEEDNDDYDDRKQKSGAEYRYRKNTDTLKHKSKTDSIKLKHASPNETKSKSTNEKDSASRDGKQIATIETNENITSPIYLLSALL